MIMKKLLLRILIGSSFGISGVLFQHLLISIILCVIGFALFEIYDKQNNLVNTGVLTCSLGIPKLDIPQIDQNAVTHWSED